MRVPNVKLMYGLSTSEKEKFKPMLTKVVPQIKFKEDIILSIEKKLTNLEVLINRMTKEFLTINKKIEDLYFKLNLK